MKRSRSLNSLQQEKVKTNKATKNSKPKNAPRGSIEVASEPLPQPPPVTNDFNTNAAKTKQKKGLLEKKAAGKRNSEEEKDRVRQKRQSSVTSSRGGSLPRYLLISSESDASDNDDEEEIGQKNICVESVPARREENNNDDDDDEYNKNNSNNTSARRSRTTKQNRPKSVNNDDEDEMPYSPILNLKRQAMKDLLLEAHHPSSAAGGESQQLRTAHQVDDLFASLVYGAVSGSSSAALAPATSVANQTDDNDEVERERASSTSVATQKGKKRKAKKQDERIPLLSGTTIITAAPTNTNKTYPAAGAQGNDASTDKRQCQNTSIFIPPPPRRGAFYDQSLLLREEEERQRLLRIMDAHALFFDPNDDTVRCTLCTASGARKPYLILKNVTMPASAISKLIEMEDDKNDAISSYGDRNNTTNINASQRFTGATSPRPPTPTPAAEKFGNAAQAEAIMRLSSPPSSFSSLHPSLATPNYPTTASLLLSSLLKKNNNNNNNSDRNDITAQIVSRALLSAFDKNNKSSSAGMHGLTSGTAAGAEEEGNFRGSNQGGEKRVTKTLHVSDLIAHINSRRHLSSIEHWQGVTDPPATLSSGDGGAEDDADIGNHDEPNGKSGANRHIHSHPNATASSYSQLADSHHHNDSNKNLTFDEMLIHRQKLKMIPINYTLVEINNIPMLLTHSVLFPDVMFGRGATLFDLTTKLLLLPNEIGALQLFANHRYLVVELKLPLANSRPPSECAPLHFRHSRKEVSREYILRKLPMVSSDTVPNPFQQMGTMINGLFVNNNDNMTIGGGGACDVSPIPASVVERLSSRRSLGELIYAEDTEWGGLVDFDTQWQSTNSDQRTKRRRQENRSGSLVAPSPQSSVSFLYQAPSASSSQAVTTGEFEGSHEDDEAANGGIAGGNRTIRYNGLFPTEAQQRLEGSNRRIQLERSRKML